jgi:hypothetical protein
VLSVSVQTVYGVTRKVILIYEINIITSVIMAPEIGEEWFSCMLTGVPHVMLFITSI